MFNFEEITLKKSLREKFLTKKFVKEEINNETIYYEDDNSFGLYCEKGLDVGKIIKNIKKLKG